jgi:hypothetical protein
MMKIPGENAGTMFCHVIDGMIAELSRLATGHFY